VAFKKKRKTLGILCLAVIGYGFIFAIVAFFISKAPPVRQISEKCPRCRGQMGTEEPVKLERGTNSKRVSLAYTILAVVLGGLVGLFLLVFAVTTWAEGDDGIIQWVYGSTIAGAGMLVIGFAFIGWGVEAVTRYRKADLVPGVKFKCSLCNFKWAHTLDASQIPTPTSLPAANEPEASKKIISGSLETTCPRCGTLLTVGVKFCKKCGNPITDLHAGQSVQSPTPMEAAQLVQPMTPKLETLPGKPAAQKPEKLEPEKKTPRTRKRLPKWGWWVGGGVLLALIAAAVVLVIVTRPVPLPESGATRLREIDGMTEIYIPEGEFLMGGDDSVQDEWPGEIPQHTVLLDAYWIDQHEVTNAQYALCVAADACTEPAEKYSNKRNSYYGHPSFENHPVLMVTIDQAREYCGWAGGSLPTEAQWEKAARGTDGQMYPWGDEPPDETLLNYDLNVDDTTEVCSYPEGNSPYGLCDMAGNLWEYASDWYNESYYRNSPDSNPEGPASGTQIVVRGGSFADTEDVFRASFRFANDIESVWVNFGFRCVSEP
jgi:formylglycine-generating enzyme required for sulfatase activity/phage FluMu protein Com